MFDSNAADYDNWFDRHSIFFENELLAIRELIPVGVKGVEIGAGTGRFAKALDIPIGIEPSHAMAQMAIARGITIVKATAEDLPFHSLSFDFVLMVTTVCFLDNIPKAFNEAHRILKKNGSFVIGMIDKGSELGKKYEAQKATNPWYKDAHFHSVREISDLLEQSGFTEFEYMQTLFSVSEEITEPEPGSGKGSFVVIKAQKQ